MNQLSSRPRLPAAEPVPAVHAQSNLALASPGGEVPFDLREIVAKVWRGKRLIILTVLAGSLLGYLAIQNLTPRYTAYAKVMLETRSIRVDPTEPVVPGLALDAEVIEGELQVVTSRELARKVTDRMNLVAHPEFNPEIVQDDDAFDLLDLLDYWPSDLSAYARSVLDRMDGDATAPTDQQRAERLQKKIVDTYLDRLSASQIGQSPVIQIAFSSEDPSVAERVANAVAEMYREQQIELKNATTQQASRSLQESIGRLREEVQDADRAIEVFRSQSGLVEGNDSLLNEQQMAELSSQLVTARVARQDAEARLRQAQSNPNSAPEVLESDLIQDLRTRQAELRRILAEERGEFGPRHPRILNTESQLADITTNIQSEINRIVQGLRSRAESERQREAELQRSLDLLGEQSGALRNELVRLRALERERDAKRDLLESQLARAQETAAQEGFQLPDARIISRAELPEAPSFPDKKLLMLIAFCGSAAVGVSLAYTLQALDDRCYTVSELRNDLGSVSVLELVPSVRRRAFRSVSPIDAVVDEPRSVFSESLRNLQVTLLGSRTPPRTVLFTSSLPGEGKTSLTLAFGRFLALAGRSVVVVDCDLRRSSVHGHLGGHAEPGLVDLIDGGAAGLSDILQVDGMSGMHYIASGQLRGNPPDLFSSQEMHDLIAKLSRRFDVVLLDSAPVLAVADVRCLHPLVDQTVFVVRWSVTKRQHAREALRRLQETGYPIDAAILNDVDPDSYHKYDDTYTYHAVKSYYAH